MGTTTPREIFAAEVQSVIEELFPGLTVRRHPEAYGFLFQRGDREQAMFLDNVFLETRDLDPDRRREQVVRFVRSMETPDPSSMAWDEVRPRLVPLLRTATVFAGIPQLSTAQKPLSRPFAPFLLECVGIDSEDGTTYAAPHELPRWGVGAEEAFVAATRNADEYFRDDVEPYDRQAPYPLWHVARDDSYESSRLLVSGWLASFAGKVTGRPVAIVPHRSALLVGGDGDERCLRRLVDTAKAEYGATPRRISPALYTVDAAGKVVPFALPAGHPLASDVAVGHAMLALAEYEAQKEALKPRIEEDVFIASFKAMKREDGSVYSFATWTEGVPTLLPETDEVLLVADPVEEGQEREFLRVAWTTFVELAGEWLEREEGIHPARWRASGWPDEGVMRKLRGT
jgi:hypothetical protein